MNKYFDTRFKNIDGTKNLTEIEQQVKTSLLNNIRNNYNNLNLDTKSFDLIEEFSKGVLAKKKKSTRND